MPSHPRTAYEDLWAAASLFWEVAVFLYSLCICMLHVAGVFAQTFHQLHQSGIRPGVLYPAVSVPTAQQLSDATTWWHEELPPDAAAFLAEGPTFLSINRFERKKVCSGKRQNFPYLLCHC